jgi:hypothetical protein
VKKLGPAIIFCLLKVHDLKLPECAWAKPDVDCESLKLFKNLDSGGILENDKTD